MCCGPISGRSTSRRRWRNTPDASGDSVPAPAERSSGRWRDLGVRALSAAVLTPIAVACVWLGGIAFIVIVAVVVAGLAIEWLLLFRRLREGADGSSASPSHPGLFSAGLL